MLLHSKKLSNSSEPETPRPTLECDELDFGPKFTTLRHMSKVFHDEDMCVVLKTSSKLIRVFFVHVQIIGWDKFHTLAHNVVIGNQVIVRASSKQTIKSTIDALQV